jgi:hypothetical protein
MGGVETFLIGVYADEIARLQLAQYGGVECVRGYIVDGPASQAFLAHKKLSLYYSGFSTPTCFISAQAEVTSYICELYTAAGENDLFEGDNGRHSFPERILNSNVLRDSSPHVIYEREAVHA